MIKPNSEIFFRRCVLFIVILLLFSVSFYAKGIGYNIIQYNSNSGLSQNTIYSITKDEKGFMWFGTFDGLNRFDGYRFEKYYPEVDNLNSLTSNDITFLFLDSKNRFWISAFGGGLNRYFPDEENFIAYRNDSTNKYFIPSDYIYSIKEDKKGFLWLSTLNDGLIKFNPENGSSVKYLPEKEVPTLSNHLRSTCIDKNGIVWFGSTKGLGKLNPETGEIVEVIDDENLLKDLFILSVYGTGNSELWIGDNKGSLFKFNEKTKKLKQYVVRYQNGKKLNSSISEFYKDNEGVFWIGTRAGLFYYDEKEDKVLPSSEKLSTLHYSFDYERIESLYQSDDGVFWVGTHSNGVYKVINISGKFNHHILPEESKDDYETRTIKTFLEDSKGNYWFGKENGVVKFNSDKKNYSFLKYNPNDPNTLSFNLVSDICEDDKNNIWIATSRGLNEYNYKSGKIRRYLLDNKYENTRRVRSLHFSSDNKLYIGTSGQGVLIMENKRIIEHLMHKPDNNNTISGNLVLSIFEDKNKQIWIGTFGAGLNSYNPKSKEIRRFTFKAKNKAFFDKIYAIWEDERASENILWIASSGGLIKFDKNDYSHKYYTMNDGLPNNILYGILGDSNYNLWLSSNAGVSKFNVETERFINYDVNSGLQSMEFNFNAYMRDSKGALFFGGINGYNIFYPDSIDSFTHSNNLTFTRLIIDNKEILSSNKSRIDKSICCASSVNLNWKDNVVTFEFSSMDYTSFSGSNYAYKLEGLDKGWNFIGLKRSATYTNIPSGEYVLKVTTVDVEGNIEENFAEIAVIVSPPFWNTWLAKVVYIIIGGFLLYGFIKFYNRKKEIELLKEKEVNERLVKVDKLKAEFLAQMSHEIRTPVNTMLSFTSLLKEELSEKINDEIRTSFDVIDSGGRRLVRTIDLILNVSELQLGTYNAKIESVEIIEEIINPLLNEFISHADNKNLELQFINKVENNLSLGIDRYTITQIFINLIDNAIKYTNEGRVEVITYFDENKKFCAEIKDTGIGISEEYIAKLYEPFSQEETGYTRRYEGTGLGLSLVKKCCDINKIKIEVESNKNVGSTFKLVFQS